MNFILKTFGSKNWIYRPGIGQWKKMFTLDGQEEMENSKKVEFLLCKKAIL